MKLVLCVLALAVVVVPAAQADGLPVLGVDVGPSGVAAPDGAVRYVTLPAAQNLTVLARVDRSGGRVLGSRTIVGTYTIPAVAYDFSPGGLSGDRHTLVLIEPRQGFPRAETSLLVVNVPRLQITSVVHLRGDFSFDAVSPDGKRLFLIQYTNPGDPTRYVVRAYDVAAHRLVAKPVIDPREPGEKMRGRPLSRAASADGRFAYTLYDGNGSTPFIHALDTRNATARCIDLDQLAGTNLTRLRLGMDGAGTVVIRDGAKLVLEVDTSTFAVRPPTTPGSGFPLERVVLFPLVALLVAALLVGLRRKVRLQPYQSVGR